MDDVYDQADGGVLVAVERAAGTGRRITAGRARKQKRKQQKRRPRQAKHAGRSITVGGVSASPIVAVGVALAVVAIALGAGVASGLIGGDSGSDSSADVATGDSNDAAGGASDDETAAGGSSTTSTTGAVGGNGVYIQYADASGQTQYMYCTKAAGCGLLDVATDGTSTIGAELIDGAWRREVRLVIQRDPCIGGSIDQGAFVPGVAGDLARITTTDLRPTGTQRIDGIRVPARITGTITTRYEAPNQPGCTFEGFVGGSGPVDSPVTQFVTGAG